MFETVLVIIVIVFSVWSELNKKKKEEDFDIDFSELSSIDDFLKKGAGQSKNSNIPPSLPPLNSSNSLNRSNPKKQGRKKQKARNKQSKKELPPLPTQATSRFNEANAGNQAVGFAANKSSAHHNYASGRNVTDQGNFKLDRNQIVKSFIFSEVLRRYDINRIYDRIPSVRNDD